MIELAKFFVVGTPRPAGSKSAYPYRCGKTGKMRVRVVDASGKRGKEWRDAVAWAAKRAYFGKPVEGAVVISFAFFMPRPKSHYGTGKNAGILKPKAPRQHIIRPDTSKLLRAVEDALTGIIWKDDAQIVRLIIDKYPKFVLSAGVQIKVWEVESDL